MAWPVVKCWCFCFSLPPTLRKPVQPTIDGRSHVTHPKTGGTGLGSHLSAMCPNLDASRMWGDVLTSERIPANAQVTIGPLPLNPHWGSIVTC